MKSKLFFIFIYSVFVQLHADSPKQDILFHWYAHSLQDCEVFHHTILTFAKRYQDSGITAIGAADSNGVAFGSALADALDLPLVLQTDDFKSGDRVLIVDDVLATGSMTQISVEAVKKSGADPIEVACLIEISALQGRNNVSIPVFSFLKTE